MPVERQFVALSTCWLVAVAEPMPQGMGRASTLRKINEPLYFPLVTTGRQSCEPMPHGKSTNFGKKGDHLYFPLVWKNATRHGKRTHLGGRHCSTEQDPKEYKKLIFTVHCKLENGGKKNRSLTMLENCDIMKKIYDSDPEWIKTREDKCCKPRLVHCKVLLKKKSVSEL